MPRETEQVAPRDGTSGPSRWIECHLPLEQRNESRMPLEFHLPLEQRNERAAKSRMPLERHMHRPAPTQMPLKYPPQSEGKKCPSFRKGGQIYRTKA